MFDARFDYARPDAKEGFWLGKLWVDPTSGQIKGPAGSEQVDPRVMNVLLALASRPGELATREDLLREVWQDTIVSDESLTQCVYQLRCHLQAAAGDARYRRLVVTLPKRGYRLGCELEFNDSPTGHGLVPVHSERNRKAVFVALMVVAAAVAGAFFMSDWPYSGSEPPASPRSIAVLPFEDFSPGAEQAHLADGFTGELIGVLNRIPGLRVIARRSSFSFRGKTSDIEAIAKKLDVSYLLEGSIRKAEGRIRITAALIDVATDSYAWSETYDRQFTDVLDVQTEIARAVAESLQLTLSESAVGAVGSSYDPDAYEHYLLGRFFWNRRAPGDVERSERYYLQALAIDPQLARAWVGLAGVHWLQAWNDENRAAQLARMGNALDRALAIDPALPEAHARASAFYRAVGNERLAEQHWRTAQEIGGDSLLVVTYSAGRAIRRGYYDDAVRLQKKAVEIDPLSALVHSNYGYFLMATGRFEEAGTEFIRADELNPASEAKHDVDRAFMLALTGRHEEAIERAQTWPDGVDRDQLLAKVHVALGQNTAVEAAMVRLRAREGGESAFRLAEVEAVRGNADAAFEWLNQLGLRASEQDNQNVFADWVTRLRVSPCLSSLRDDPRWEPAIASLPRPPKTDLADSALAAQR